MAQQRKRTNRTSMHEFRTAACAVTAVLVVLSLSDTAEAQDASDRWRFAVTPYLWLPTVDAKLKHSTPSGASASPEIEVSADDYLSNLDFAAMLSGEARKNRWSFFTDVVYLDMSADDSTVQAVNFGGTRVQTNLNVDTSSSLSGVAWTLAAGYEVVRAAEVTVDAFAGFRYFRLKASTNWQLAATITGPLGGSQVFPRSGSVSDSEDLFDGIVGIRGRIRLGESAWSIPFYVDVGGGSSDLTWQGVLAIAYAFSWGDVALAYRYLYYDQGGDELVQDLSLGGPALAVTFYF